MRVLVAYAGKHGSTAGVAERIAARLRDAGLDVATADLAGKADPEGYDALVAGSAVYYGSWMKPAAAFVRRHAAELAARPVWLFSVGPLGVEVKEAEEQPKEMAEFRASVSPRDDRVFYGALDHSRLSFADRMVARAVRAPEGDFRDWDAIDAWAASIAAALTAATATTAGAVPGA